MAISYAQYEAVGAHVFLPEGPFGTVGQPPLPNFKPGTVVGGDAEGEFTYLTFAPTTSVTLNQGDVLFWDHTYLAAPLITPSAALGAGGLGVDVGTFFLGGRSGDPAASQGDYWSYTFAPGIYGIWVQRAGTSLIKTGTITSQSTPAVSTATAGLISQIAVVGHAVTVGPLFTIPQTQAFVGTTSANSPIITAVTAANGSVLYGLEKGMVLTGTGIATAPAPVIVDIQGNTITMSANAASAQSGTTVTASTQQFVASGANGASYLTSSQVGPLSNIFPNQTLNGTGVSAQTITSITGSPGNWVVNLSGTLSSAATNATYTATGYYAGYLRWPTVTAGA